MSSSSLSHRQLHVLLSPHIRCSSQYLPKPTSLLSITLYNCSTGTLNLVGMSFVHIYHPGPLYNLGNSTLPGTLGCLGVWLEIQARKLNMGTSVTNGLSAKDSCHRHKFLRKARKFYVYSFCVFCGICTTIVRYC